MSRLMQAKVPSKSLGAQAVNILPQAQLGESTYVNIIIHMSIIVLVDIDDQELGPQKY